MPNSSALFPIADQPIHAGSASSGSASGPVFQPFLYLRRQPWIAAAVFLLLCLVGARFLRGYLSPTYSAESVVYVSPTFPHELAEDHEHDRTYDDFIEQQIYAVTRYGNVKQAMAKYKDQWIQPGEDEQGAVTRVQKSLKVEQMGHSYQMSITAKSTSRVALAEFVNQLTAGYLTSARNDEFFGRDERITTLTADRQRIASELDAALAKQDKLLASLGIARFDPKSSDNPYDTQMAQLREQLSTAHEKRAEADAQASAYSGNPTAAADSSPLQQMASAQATTDPGVLTMTTQLDTRRAALLLQMNGLTPQNPLYTQSQAEIKAIDQELADLKAKATSKVATELQGRASSERVRAQRLESQLNSDLAKTQGQAAEAAPKLLQADMYADEITRLQASYALVDSRINSLSLEGSSPGSVHIVSWALPPSTPVQKRITIAIFALLFASMLGAIVAAYLADLLDPNVYTAGDIHRLLGFPPIGMLLDEKEFSSRMQSEYLLRLAGGIDQAHRRTGARTFVFTSAGLGDTRDLVKELGAELAINGLNTLVIVVGEAGAAAVRAANASAPSPAANVQASTVTKLAVGQGTELSPSFAGCEIVTVAPRGAAEYMRRARVSHNTVLVAADPLLTSAHTEYLARAADGTVLVAESGQVSKKQLSRVAKLLERLKISGIAIILSQIPKRRADQEITENAAEYATVPTA